MVYTGALLGLEDVSTADAYDLVTDYLEPDYVSGSGLADIFPDMGASTLNLPMFAVINLRTAELLYNANNQDGIMAAVQAANTP